MAIKISGSTIIDDSRNIVSAATATASSFVKTGGTSSQFLMADGSVSTGSISLTDLSVGTPASASGSGSIAYDNTTGTFTYTPPDLSSYLTSYTETQTLDDVLALGASTTRDITTTGKILFANMYATTGDLPSATTYHGMFAHVHGTGKGYFAHSGNWVQLLDTGSSINELSDVDTSTPPTTGEVLKWNGTTWSPGTDASGSGGSSAFTGLSDTPGSLGTAGQALVVNSGATALEFVTPYGDTDVSTHLNVSSASSGQILSWNGTDFAWVADQTGGGGSSYGDTDVSTHLNVSSASSGQILSWNGTDFAWVADQTGGGGGSTTFLALTDTPGSFGTAGQVLAVNSGATALEFVTPIALTDLSVTQNAAGTAGLSYDNTTGAFTYTPPDLSSYLTSYTVTASDLNSISIDALSDVDTTTAAPTDGQALVWDSTAGKWEPGTISGGGGSSYGDSDVDTHLNISSASSGQILSWNGTDYAWVADQTGGGGGGGSSDPVGTIVAWAGSSASIPSDYQLCDGGAASTTELQAITGANVPDLRDRFIIGAGNSYAVDATGGSADAILVSHSHTINNHTHSFSGSGSDTVSISISGTTGNQSNNHTHDFGANTFQGQAGSSFDAMDNPQPNGGGNKQGSTSGISQDHTHSFSGSGSDTVSISISGDTGTPSDTGTDTQGSSGTGANLPPYYALCYIVKHTATSGSSTFTGLSDTPGSMGTAGQYLAVNSGGTALEFVAAPSGGGASDFTGLTDTPGSMGTAGQYLAVNSGGTALEFVAAPSGGSSTFLALTDTPSTFTASKYLAINSAGDAIEFVDAPSGGGGGGTSLTVQTRNGSSGAEGNEATGISKITFNSASGFSVSSPNTGEAFISLGSAFAPWSVDGQTTLTPEGEEEVEFIAGSGITITTDNTSTPKSITFTASGGGGGGGGGATTLADLTDTNISSPATGAVLKWNGTTWFAGTDNTGSGGGGGGGGGSGDGSSPLGANSRLDENLQNTYGGGLLTLTNTTKINDAIDQINLILVKLAPPTPDPLSVRSLSIKNTYTAIKSGTNEVLSNQVVNTGRPQSNDVSNFYDGANGTLTFDIDGTPDGSIALSVNEDGNTNVGSDGGLTITNDSDPYANATTGSNFWEQLTARVQASSDLAAGSTYTYNLVHSITGSVSASFFVDAPNTGGALTVTGESVDTSAAATGYVSGVPTYSANTTIAVSCTVNGAVTKAYNQNKICTMTSNVTTTSSGNVAPVTDPGYNEGDAITISGHQVTIQSNKFSDGDFTVSLKGINSKGDSGTATSLTVPGRVDTKSIETSRITSGSGQYPASGYGDPYDSTQSLLNNEELQMKNGKFEYPSVDYSTNQLAGPNYSTASGTRYVTFLAGNANNALDGVVNINATGLTANALNETVTDGIDMYLKVEGANTGWFNINQGPNYSAGNLTADGDRALLYSGSNASTKACAWGSVPLTGPVYVRLGLPAGSNIKITGATFT